MHEFSLCRNLLEQVLATARDHQARTVKRVDVRLWPHGGIDAGQLASAFAIAGADTAAAQAELRIETMPRLTRCPGCGREHDALLPCPDCPDSDAVEVPPTGLMITHVELLP